MSNVAEDQVRNKVPSGRAGLLVAAFIALALVLPIVGFATLRLYTPQVMRDAEANLVAIADLKAKQLENWLLERRGDAEMLMMNSDLAERAMKLASGRGGAQDPARVRSFLRQVVSSYHYSEAMVVTPDGRIIAAAGEDPYLGAETQAALERLEPGAIRRVRLYIDERGHTHIEWIVSLGHPDTMSRAPVVVLRIEAGDFIYPLVQAWPGSSASGETLLVRREGESVLFLNELRHRKNTALRFALPLSQFDLPAAEAIRVGAPGTIEGVDYRGRAVLAAYRPVAESNWFVIAKLDRDEVLAPLRMLSLWIGAVAALAALLLGGGLVLAWRTQRHAFEMQREAQLARAELEVTRLDESAREAQARAQLLIEAALDAVITIDQDDHIVGWNAQAERLFGYPQDEIMGRAMADTIVPPVHREAHRAGVAHFLGTGQSNIIGKRVEVPGLRADGTEFPMELTVSALNRGGHYLFSAYARDITERKHAEKALHDSAQRFRSVFNSSPIAASIATFAEGRFVEVNANYERDFGWAREDMIGRTSLELGLWGSSESRATWVERLRQDGRVVDFEAEWRRRSGESCSISLSAEIIDLDGVPCILAYAMDVGERKRLVAELERHRDHLEDLVASRTEQLAAARDAAEVANRAKSAFLANMSHEIRTPLNAIVGLAHLLRRTVATPQQAQQMEKIDTAAAHLLAIINDVLDLSKIEAGRLELEQTDFHVGALLDNVRSLVADAAGAKGIVVDVAAAPAATWLHGDPTRVRQALLNLASNAVKFTPAGTVWMRTDVVDESDGELTVRFEVRDTGIGISADKQVRLFRAFEQADISTTRRYGGTGLGLAITQRLARLMGGDAGVTSAPGEGATFWFTVKVGRGRGPEPIVNGGKEAGANDGDQAMLRRLRPYAGTRILVVDDVDTNREVIQLLLDGTGLSLDYAADGRQAVERAIDGRPALILMDIQMPLMDGLEATRAIHDCPGLESMPIIAMTANAFEEDRRASREAGMVDFIPKPVDPDTLYRVVLRWLQLAANAAAAGAEAAPAVPQATGDARSEAPVEPLPGLDAPRGIAVWRKADVYRNFLRKFVADYGDAARRLESALAGGDRKAAAALAHKLKGAAGNLALTNVAAAATDMDRRFKQGEDGVDVGALQAAIEEAVASIGRFAPEGPGAHSAPVVQGTALKDAGDRLAMLLQALDHDTPDDADPIIAELERLLSPARLAEVRARVADFDFRGAEAATRRLASALGLALPSASGGNS